MNKITKIAVKNTIDPMQVVMDCLFENKDEILISDKILECIKKTHSYMKRPHVKYEVYTFHKRVRGTDALFSFLVTTGADGNKVSTIECITAELGLMESHINSQNEKIKKKVYFMFQGEENL